MGTTGFIRALARGARGKEAAKALVLPDFIGAVSSPIGKETLSLTAFAAPTLKTVTKKSKVTSCTVSFTPSQDLHGYDKPWPAGGYKNIIPSNASAWEQGAIFNGGSYSDSDSRIRIINKYVIKPNTMYTLSVYGDIVPALHLWRADNSYISDSSWITSLPYTFTTPNDAAIIAVTCRSSIGYFDPISPDIMGDTAFIQIEEGGSATEWTPYENICPISGTDTVNVYVAESYDPAAAPEATVSLGAERYGGTAEIVAGTGNEAWTELTLNGTETWDGSGTHGMYTEVDTLVKKWNDYQNSMICDILPPKSNHTVTAFTDSEYAITGWGSTSLPNQNWIYIAAAGINNTTDLKSWLAQNPVKVVFVKATPTPYTFPPASDQLLLQKGDNYNWATMTNT